MFDTNNDGKSLLSTAEYCLNIDYLQQKRMLIIAVLSTSRLKLCDDTIVPSDEDYMKFDEIMTDIDKILLRHHEITNLKDD